MIDRFVYKLILLLIISTAVSSVLFTIGFFLFESQFESAFINFFTLNDQSSKIESLVTPSKVLAINFVVFLCSITLISKFKKISHFIFDELKWFLQILNDVVLTAFKSKAGLIIIIPTTALLFLAYTFTVTYDEALSYSLFISRGPLVSITYYPVPNNHVFFSLISTLITSIFSFDPVFLMRLLSIISFVLSAFFIFRILNIFISTDLSILICSLSIVMPFTMYYGFLGRGYSLITLLFFISTYILSLQSINKKNDLKIGIFSFLSAIGIFTIPTYIYAFFIHLVLIFFLIKKNTIQIILKSLIITTLMALTFYSPIIIFSGLDALVNNEYVESQNRIQLLNKLPKFIFETFSQIFNSRIIAVLFLINILLIGTKCLSRYKSKFDQIILIIFFTPILLISFQGVQPPPRIFIFWYSIFILSSYIYFFRDTKFFQYVNPIFIALSLQIVILLKTIDFPQSMVLNDPYAVKYSEIISKDQISILSSVDHMNTFLLYEKSKNNYRDMKVHYVPKFYSGNIQENYDWVILNKGEPAPVGYKNLYNENGWIFYIKH